MRLQDKVAIITGAAMTRDVMERFGRIDILLNTTSGGWHGGGSGWAGDIPCKPGIRLDHRLGGLCRATEVPYRGP